MTTLLKLRTVFGAKKETTPGTAETINKTTDCAFKIYDLEITPEVTMTERPAIGSAGTRRSVPGGRKAKATFKWDMAATGLAVPTLLDLLLPACGLVRTAPATVFTPITQTPDTPSAKVNTLTIAKWMDGKRSSIYGAMGSFRIVAPTDGIPYFEFDFNGLLGDEVDDALPTPTYPTDTELNSSGGILTWDSVPLCTESTTFDLANTFYTKHCPNVERGYEYTIITNRKPNVIANPESGLVANQNRLQQLVTGVEAVYRYVIPCPGYVSGTGAKSIEILANKAQLLNRVEGNREGVSTDDLTFQFNQNGSALDSDFSLTINLAS